VNLPTQQRDALLASSGVRHCSSREVVSSLPQGSQVLVTAGADVAVNLHHLADGSAALHLINYDYDRTADAIRLATSVDVAVSLPFEPGKATVVAPGQPRQPVEFSLVDGRTTVVLDQVGVCTVIVFDPRD
jgi:hypothetical protein